VRASGSKLRVPRMGKGVGQFDSYCTACVAYVALRVRELAQPRAALVHGENLDAIGIEADRVAARDEYQVIGLRIPAKEVRGAPEGRGTK